MIVAAGLTPAWQFMLGFEHLELGEVNRARDAFWLASGKVLNVARALACLQQPVRAVALVGGATGAAIQADWARAGWQAAWVPATHPTRVCTTLREAALQRVTELVENAGPVSAAELEEFTVTVAAQAGQAAALVLAGSLPRGTPPTFYQQVIARARAARATTTATKLPVVLDARGDELLAALAAGVEVVKPNRSELAQTVGYAVDEERSLLAAMNELLDGGAGWVVVSEGARAVWAASSAERCVARPPTVSAVNPIGCGDSLAAALGVAVAAGRPLAEAVRYATAVATAAATTDLPAEVDPAQVARLLDQVEVSGW